VVHHADSLAERLGEPYGTLILTLSVISIEVSLFGAIMLAGENEPTLARDTMFAVLMIVLNGMVGTTLLVGGWKNREQHYNLQGAKAFLAVLVPLAVLTISLVINRSVELGLNDLEMLLLLLTLAVSTLTFTGGRTSILQGAIHLVLFLACVFLIFNPWAAWLAGRLRFAHRWSARAGY
jgi:Ca2+:H+ antiporter